MTTRRIGATAIFDAVARQIGLREDLIIVWGPRAADLALSLACHWLTTASNACYLFQSWAEGYLLPFDLNSPVPVRRNGESTLGRAISAPILAML